MNKRNFFTLLILTMMSAQLEAQHNTKNYFSAPLDSTLRLIGTFGEIRHDHFHSGIDLSTDQQEGKNVHAAADGYVSRIKIAAGGFGKAIYITHPNGMVTVYAHLKKFRNDVQQYVVAHQYEQKSYEIELPLKPKEFKVKKGEVIALSGSSGDVSGPHLHFEIRDGATEEPVNPLLFGFEIQDTIPPVISAIRVFPVPGQGILSNSDTAADYYVQKYDKMNTINTPDNIQVFGNIGFGIEVTDYEQNSEAALGIYSVQLKVDSTIVYEYKMDKFNFNDTRYVNAHIDYASRIRNNLTIQRCFRLPGNHLKIYPDTNKRGYVNFADDAAHNIEFTTSDFNGNKSTLIFPVISNPLFAQLPYEPVPEGAVLVTPFKGIAIHKPNVEIVIPTGAVYDNYQFLSSESPLRENMITPVYHVGDKTEAVHNAITVGIKPEHFPDSMKAKAAIISFDRYGNQTYEGGTWKNGFLTAQVRHFGDFTMALDTTPPSVTKEYFPADLNSSRGALVQFTVTDNLSGIKDYYAEVDGKWLLMEYNKRENLISGDISAFPQNNQHHIVVKVTDEKGNERTLSDSFYY
ncbi:MAG: M23 family metallopeptidase [Bacteroidetes bacterium]|nr:M23 family metallopeptidase [Bacteroidota bacterium]